MFKRMIAASIAVMMLLALIPASMAQTDKIQSYNGLVGSNSPLYGIKLYAEKLDLFLTFDSNEKLKKQLSHADLRLAEAMAAANNSDAGAVDAALTQYEDTMAAVANGSTDVDNGSSEIGDHLNTQEEAYIYIMNELENNNVQIKNGMPFIFVEDADGVVTAYFAPPGQLKKVDTTKLPSGLAKKGYKSATSKLDGNGSKVWPWDDVTNKYVVTHSNGNGNGNGNGNKK